MVRVETAVVKLVWEPKMSLELGKYDELESDTI